jgi:hypothetical protein
MTTLRPGQSTVRILAKIKNIYFLEIVYNGSGAHPASLSMDKGVLSSGQKQ